MRIAIAAVVAGLLLAPAVAPTPASAVVVKVGIGHGHGHWPARGHYSWHGHPYAYRWHGGYYNYYWHNRYWRGRYRCHRYGWCYR
jgi:hypothetical protein